MERRAEVLIIGGGAIGICSAYYLSENGINVVLMEKGEVGSGCSLDNAGLVTPSHIIPLAAPGVIAKGFKWMFNADSPFYIKPRLDFELFSWLWMFRRACNERQMRQAMPLLRDLSLASVELFTELSEIKEIDFGFEQRGLLMLHKSVGGERENLEMADLALQFGIDAKVLDVQQIAELEPNIQTRATGGVYYRQDAHLDPALFVKKMSTYLEQKEVVIHTHAEVVGLEGSKGKVTRVQTSRGDFVADEVVLAGGAWSTGIIRNLQIKLPVQPAKGYSFTFEQPRTKPRIPILLSEPKVAVTPLAQGLRFAGTLEFAGLDLSINMRRVRAILNTIPAYFSDIDPPDIRQAKIWSGLRPCTPDGLPFLGRCEEFQNLIVATGHAMLGISLAPITGKLVSELVLHKTPSIVLSDLNVERYRS
jgi:D-amino-acid dehydrogenase